MFLLYAVLTGLLLGLAFGGRPAGLAALEFRWAPLAFGGFLAQVALFAGPVSDRVGDLGPALYVASTVAVLVAVLRNRPDHGPRRRGRWGRVEPRRDRRERRIHAGEPGGRDRRWPDGRDDLLEQRDRRWRRRSPR